MNSPGTTTFPVRASSVRRLRRRIVALALARSVGARVRSLAGLRDELLMILILAHLHLEKTLSSVGKGPNPPRNREREREPFSTLRRGHSSRFIEEGNISNLNLYYPSQRSLKKNLEIRNIDDFRGPATSSRRRQKVLRHRPSFQDPLRRRKREELHHTQPFVR